MKWIVNIETTEEERKQRVKIVFDPMAEMIHVYGEVKLKNNWTVFSEETHKMKIELKGLQRVMEIAVANMRARLKEYENLDKGFGVLKWVGFEED